MKRLIVFLSGLLVLICVTGANAGTYWASPTGTATWADCQSAAPLGGTSACSISTANANAHAGDTVNLRDGTESGGQVVIYPGGISPSNTGTDINHRITFQAYPGASPTFSGSYYPINLSANSYIVINGITVHNTTVPYYLFSVSNGSNYNEIAHCVFYQSGGVTNDMWGYIGGMCQGVSSYACPSVGNWIHDNVMHDVSTTVPCSDGENIWQIGSAYYDVLSDNNTVENNVFYHSGHATIETFTHKNVIRNNILHNEGFRSYPAHGCMANGSDASPGKCNGQCSNLCSDTTYYCCGGCNGSTCAYPSTSCNNPDPIGSYPGNGKYGHRNMSIDSDRATPTNPTYNLIEGNRIGYASANPDNSGAEGVSFVSTHSIFRYNAVFGSDGPAIYFKGGNLTDHIYVYNNTLFQNGQFSGTSNLLPMATLWSERGSTSNVFVNNLLYLNNPSNAGATQDFNCAGYPCSPFTITAVSNNFCASVGTPYCTASGDPKFVSTPAVSDSVIASIATLPNLNLQAGSGAIDSGTYLTQAKGAGSSSTSLVVNDAMYFQDGTWGSSLSSVQPDWIAIGTVTDVVQIGSINYATSTITLASPMTWADGAHIWLYKKSDGTPVLYGSAPDLGAYEFQPEGLPPPQNLRIIK